MRVSGPSSSNAATASRPGATATGFQPAETGAPDAAAPLARAPSLGAMGSLETLLALQAAPDALERRRRSVRRGERILDALDALKLAVLDGALGSDAATGLSAAIKEARLATGEAALDNVLEQIELRAAVELAKRETFASSANALGALTNGRTPPGSATFS
jgi:hypothetical protein